jgi:nicotinamidase-related amidase
VVVDMCVGFTDPMSPLGCQADAAVAATGRLLHAARESGRPAIFTTIAYDAAGLVAARPFLEKVPALAALTVGSSGSRIDHRLAPGDDEPVLAKAFASAFCGTPLAAILAGHACDALVVAGASTSGCVRTTVVDAMQHGYRCLVAREAVADRSQESHDVTLRDIDARYGDVVGIEEALAALRQPGGRRHAEAAS